MGTEGARINAVLPWLLGAAALVLQPHYRHSPAWLLALTAAFAAWRYWAGRRGAYLPGRVVRGALALATLAAVYAQYGTIWGHEAGTALLVALFGLKLLELRGVRDGMLLVFMLFFLAFSAFLYGQSLWLGFYLVAVVIAGCVILLRLQQPEPLAPGTNLRIALGLMLRALPVMLLFYVLFPRIEGGLWGLPSLSGAGLTGLGYPMHLGGMEHLARSDAVAFRVLFRGAPPPRPLRYWRTMVLWHTDGRTWRRGAPAGGGEIEYAGAPVHYTVMLQPSREPWLPALDLPASVPAGAAAEPGHVLRHDGPIRSRISYTLTSYPSHQGRRLSPAARAAALQLPASVSPRVRALAARWRADAADTRAIVAQALAYFRHQPFHYTLDPPPLTGPDPVATFLFVTRRGFCEHFAAAFVTLMRAAGVPSRLVLGYQGGAVNPAGGYLVVRQEDAHAWAEVWFPGLGWQRVDPTAAVAPGRVDLGMEALERLRREGVNPNDLSASQLRSLLAPGWIAAAVQGLSDYWDAVNVAWYRWVLDYGPERQAALLAALGFRFVSGRALGISLSVAVTVVLALLAWARPWRPGRMDPPQRLYLRFCRKLARAGVRRAAGEGPLAFQQRLARLHPELAGPAAEVVGLYIGLRYGPGGGDTELRRLRGLVARFRAR